MSQDFVARLAAARTPIATTLAVFDEGTDPREIAAQVDAFYQQMAQAGMPAGSARAQRLFA